MKHLGRHLRWTQHPQLLLASVLVCLLVAGFGSVAGRAEVSPIREQAAPVIVDVPHKQLPDCTVKPCLALTFDDGPDPRFTPQVLDILEREQAAATFFIVGSRVAGKENILRRMHANGHEIGNHTWNHANLTKISPVDVQAQIQNTQSAIMRAGVPAPHLMRPPYGEINPGVANHLHLTVVRWNIDPENWDTLDAQSLTTNLLVQSRPGGIVLMHDIRQSTVDALNAAIPELKSRFQLVTVSEMMALSAGDEGQFFGR